MNTTSRRVSGQSLASRCVLVEMCAPMPIDPEDQLESKEGKGYSPVWTPVYYKSDADEADFDLNTLAGGTLSQLFSAVAPALKPLEEGLQKHAVHLLCLKHPVLDFKPGPPLIRTVWIQRQSMMLTFGRISGLDSPEDFKGSSNVQMTFYKANRAKGMTWRAGTDIQGKIVAREGKVKENLQCRIPC
ncbi:hypothetical protein AAES_35736 [Amazona aestiva]|uniref:Uncharacterized protein n=1 Tax=Amazona aestiva TaxID=12930 RepID=A0A0Q3SLS6_AMAAE|nr:hypothetical protein AAES_35736 [Amazona aestiva]